MPRNKLISNIILLPMSKLYGLGVGIRNLMFKWGIFKRRSFDIPVIVIGNLSVGGTGKTPHTEYVVSLLRNRYRVAIISRGYKRKTKGFVLAGERSTPLDIGDEPYQMYHKFDGDVPVAVCENRVHAIERIRAIDPSINLIVLDDAFQHRYVKPTVSIVLTEFNRPVFYDNLLPYGRLREPVKAIYDADIVVVTKCPDYIKPIEFRLFKKNLSLYDSQRLTFSRMVYNRLTPLFPNEARHIPSLNSLPASARLLIISGIANPRPFARYIKSFRTRVSIKVFSDHHNFTRRDMDAIQAKFDEIDGSPKYIITTEKDAVRLINNPYYPHELKAISFYIPISIRFDDSTSDNFDIALQRLIDNNSHAPNKQPPHDVIADD